MFLKISKMKGQASLELSVAMIATVMLIVATVRLFVWICARIVKRQVYYESTRVIATQPGNEGEYNEPTFAEVNLIGTFI